MVTELSDIYSRLYSGLNMSKKLHIPPFYTMEMMKLADDLQKNGQTIYHLEVGQPIVPTPKIVSEEAIRVLREQPLNYCSALGLYELRQTIAEHYQYAYGLSISPKSIIITPGTSLGLYIALLMNFKKGDQIAIASPSYPCYRNVIKALGFEVVEISTFCEENYLITPESLENVKQNISGILIASPNNPTGSMYSKEKLKDLSFYCHKNNIQIISDEIYHGITYEEQAETILNFNNNAIAINGFSKYFAMTGWRLGWMVIPEEDIARYESLLQNLILCSSTLTQMAAVKAFLAYSELDEHVKKYKKNRDILYDALLSEGISKLYKPQGAFYMYLELSGIQLSSMDFCKKLLMEEGVAVAPGLDFCSNSDLCSIRLSFCQNANVIEVGAEKLNRFIKMLRKK